MKWNKLAKWVRYSVLLILLIYVTYESYMHQVLGGGKAPSVHALCPFGALESLYALLFTGNFIQKIYSGTLVLLIITVVIALLFRRSFCGLLCPFGTLQEIFAKLGKAVLGRRYNVPQKMDRYFRLLKYFVLILTVGLAWRFGTLWMATYDPYSAYSHIFSAASTMAENPLAVIGFIILAISIIGSFIYDRFFCKYLCPVGAFYAIIGKISPTKIERDANLCINCNKCSKICPVNIDVAKKAKVTSAECINCNECVIECPVKGALEIKTAKKKVNPLVFIVLVVGLFFGAILIAQATGYYQLLPSKVKVGEIISIVDIKGSYTIEESAAATGLSLAEIYEKLGIPENVPKDTQMNKLSTYIEGFDFDEAKENAFDGNDANNTLTEESEAQDDSNKFDASSVKGSMSIQEAADSLGMELKEFYTLFKINASISSQTLMKDIKNVQAGYEFGEVKSSLQ